MIWEARYLLRAGPTLEPIDPWDALEPMRDVLHGHQVCLTEFADVAAPEVRAALDADLVVVLDGPAHAALDHLPFPVTAPRVALDAVLPWTVHLQFGACSRLGSRIPPPRRFFERVH